MPDLCREHLHVLYPLRPDQLTSMKQTQPRRPLDAGAVSHFVFLPPGLPLKLLPVCLLEQLEALGVPAAHGDAVHGLGPHAQNAATGDDDLVGVHQLHHGEGLLLHGDAVLPGQGQQVLPGDAGEDQLVGGGGAQDPVL